MKTVFIKYIVLISFILPFYFGCAQDSPKRKPAVRKCLLSVRYQPEYYPSSISVLIDEQQAPLSLIDDEAGTVGLWGADIWLSSGLKSYLLEVDGVRFNDPEQPLKVMKNGVLHSLYRVPNCQQGRWFRVKTKQTQKADRVEQTFHLAYERALSTQELNQASRASYQPELVGVPLDQTSVEVWIDGEPYPFELKDELLLVNTSNLGFGKHQLQVVAKDQQGILAETFQAPFWVEAQEHRWTRGVMYQVVLDRLSPPQDMNIPLSLPTITERWGGQLDQVSALLESDYLSNLGVTSLWLSPLSPNPTGLWQGVEGGEAKYEGYHGYWSSDSRKVGEEWGGAEALKKVISLAHAKGIRVLVDVALNHLHESHPYVSEHPAWFAPPGCLCGRPGCDWGTYIETCRFTEYLPDIRWINLEVLQQQIDDAVWWIDTFNLDGLRVDAVPMMPRWVIKYLSAEVKRRFEGLRTRQLLIGETFTGPKEWSRIGWYLGPHGLDGQFDFPWMWALRSVFAWEQEDLRSLISIWQAGEGVWSNSASLMGHFIDNHDVTRFVSEAAGSYLGDPWQLPPLQEEVTEEALNKQWLALALNYTLPGIPVLYYGDESGLAGANDPDNRRPYWPLAEDDPLQLSDIRADHHTRVAHLGRLRRCLRSFTSADNKLQFLASNAERLSFKRGSGGSEILVLIQRKAQAVASDLHMPLSISTTIDQTEDWIDLLSNEAVPVSYQEIKGHKKVLFHLPPIDEYTVKILARRTQGNQCLNIVNHSAQ